MADYGLVSQALEGLGRSLAGVGEQKARNILAKSEADRSAAQFELTKAQGMGQLELAKSGALLAERSAANEHEYKMAELAEKKRNEEYVSLADAVMGSSMAPDMKEKVRPFLEKVDPDLGIPYGATLVQRGKVGEYFKGYLDFIQAGALKRETLAQAAAKAEADRAEKKEGREVMSADRRYAADLASADRRYAANLAATTSRQNAALSSESKKTGKPVYDSYTVPEFGGQWGERTGTKVVHTVALPDGTFVEGTAKQVNDAGRAWARGQSGAPKAPTPKAPNSVSKQLELFEAALKRGDSGRLKRLADGMTPQGKDAAAKKWPGRAYWFGR